MKIAMIGTRGIPGGYSGFETAVEELSKRLVERGHEVVVYCRSHMVKYEGDTYKGVKLVKLPTIANKHLDTFVHTGISTIHVITRERCDVALYFIAGNSPFSFFPRLTGIPTAINVDGLDSQRAKWNRIAKKYLRFAERLAPKAATRVITDSRVVERYYKERFGADSVYIPYGALMEPVSGSEWLDKFGLKPREYILFVGRLVPENQAHVLIDAYCGLKTNKKLVIVGSASYAQEYIGKLEASKCENVIFTGYVFGEGYRQLSQNAYIFAIPTIVGGTHPVIVEALAAGNCVVVSNHPPNMETVSDAGVSFEADKGSVDLRNKLKMLINDPALVESYREKAYQRAFSEFDWEVVTDQYEDLCRQLIAGKKVNRGKTS
ncbi:MAG: glycosyltransferase [Thermoleophilia bacterium]